MIRVRDVLTGETVEFDNDMLVEFDVEPPISKLSTDQGGGTVRLVSYEGQITVRSVNGALDVNGRHALELLPVGANGIVVRLRDSREVTVTR